MTQTLIARLTIFEQYGSLNRKLVYARKIKPYKAAVQIVPILPLNYHSDIRNGGNKAFGFDALQPKDGKRSEKECALIKIE